MRVLMVALMLMTVGMSRGTVMEVTCGSPWPGNPQELWEFIAYFTCTGCACTHNAKGYSNDQFKWTEYDRSKGEGDVIGKISNTIAIVNGARLSRATRTKDKNHHDYYEMPIVAMLNHIINYCGSYGSYGAYIVDDYYTNGEQLVLDRTKQHGHYQFHHKMHQTECYRADLVNSHNAFGDSALPLKNDEDWTVEDQKKNFRPLGGRSILQTGNLRIIYGAVYKSRLIWSTMVQPVAYVANMDARDVWTMLQQIDWGRFFASGSGTAARATSGVGNWEMIVTGGNFVPAGVTGLTLDVMGHIAADLTGQGACSRESVLNTLSNVIMSMGEAEELDKGIFIAKQLPATFSMFVSASPQTFNRGIELVNFLARDNNALIPVMALTITFIAV